jgi:hypothetical protein
MVSLKKQKGTKFENTTAKTVQFRNYILGTEMLKDFPTCRPGDMRGESDGWPTHVMGLTICSWRWFVVHFALHGRLKNKA